MRRSNLIIIGNIMAAILLFGTAGCRRQRKTEEGVSSESAQKMELTATSEYAVNVEEGALESEKIETESNESQSAFPSAYKSKKKMVTFDCALEVPNEFLNGNFSMPSVRGINYGDPQKQYDVLVKPHESEIAETDKNESLEDGKPDDMFYDLANGDHYTTGNGVNFYTPKGIKYGRVLAHDEGILSHNIFTFGTPDDKINEIKKLVNDIGYSSDQYAFSWYSLSSEERNKMEQQAVEEGRVTSENIPDQWEQGDDTYTIYAWQNYNGLDVLPWYMTVNMRAAEMDFSTAPLTAVFDEDGLQTFQMSAPIMLENTDKTGEAVQVLPFEKIADAVENRFESMITDQHYTVKKAKMVLRTYNDENQKLSAEVVWHLTVTDDKGNIQILMYDALTGKEIFLT